MKKQYFAPEVDVASFTASNIICSSVIFGDGSTSDMHSRHRGMQLDDYVDDWDE